MSEYIKNCPSCGHNNPESEYNCQKCQYFLGDVEPVAQSEYPEVNPAEEVQTNEGFSGVTPEQDEYDQNDKSDGSRKTDRYVQPPMLSIEYAGKVYDVQSGSVMGKADATSTAELQITGLPGHIHRRHCRFDFTGNQWQVTAVENEEYTNPTYVNGGKILPNQSKSIQNGDRLSLCDITFQVRIIS